MGNLVFSRSSSSRGGKRHSNGLLWVLMVANPYRFHLVVRRLVHGLRPGVWPPVRRLGLAVVPCIGSSLEQTDAVRLWLLRESKKNTEKREPDSVRCTLTCNHYANSSYSIKSIKLIDYLKKN